VSGKGVGAAGNEDGGCGCVSVLQDDLHGTGCTEKRMTKDDHCISALPYAPGCELVFDGRKDRRFGE